MTKKQEEKRQKRNQTILVLVLVLVLLGSSFGVMVNSFGDSGSESENSIEYNGNDFIYQNGFWILEKYGGTFYFLNTPHETEELIFENNVSRSIESYSGVPIYIYSEDSDAELEVYRNLYQVAERMQNACPEGVECSNSELPKKDCSNNLIIIKESSENKIVQNENCIYIQGEKENLIKLSDEFLFKILGVK